MVCASCSAANPDTLQFCRNCGQALAALHLEAATGGPAGSSSASALDSRTQLEAGVQSPPADSQLATQDLSFAPYSSPVLQPGSTLAQRYRIDFLIGQGGMGTVYKAFDTELGRTVALKLVRPELASRPGIMQRFKQELLLASRVSHKHILRIHDLGDTNGIKFITMAYVEGTDLANLMEKVGRLPVERSVSFARQLCAALEAAHTEGVIHRDLKPQNILIDRSDNLYVSDFGLAKSLEPAAAAVTRTGQILGTPRYMSPEQVESKDVDQRSDLYSFGLIFYEMLTAQLPFGGESALQLMYQRLTGQAGDPRTICPDLPDYLANIVLKCLERYPARRYQSAREILHDLEARYTPVVRGPSGTSLLKRRFPKAARLAALLASGVAVTATLAFLIPSVRHRTLPPPAGLAKPAQVAIQKYVAVLPLRTIGDDQNMSYVADGLTDALTAKLSALKSVYVAPTSAVTAALKQRDPTKIAHALGVKLLVQGTVSGSSNDTLAITVSLDEPYTDDKGDHTWSRLLADFTGPQRDLFALQDRIFSSLINVLLIKPGTEELASTSKRPTEDLGAYELYLKARKVWRESQTDQDLRKAIDLFDQAIKVDPRFALAYAGLADADRKMWDKTSDASWSQKALIAAQKARALNDNLPEVHFTLGGLYTDTGRTAEAVAELQRALQLAPNSDEVLRLLGTAYMKASRQKEAIAAYTRATEVNPYLWTNYNALGGAYFSAGENDRALAAFQHITALEPARAEGWEGVGMVYYRLGRWSECIAAFQKAVPIQSTGQNDSNLGTAYYFLGRFQEAAQMYQKAVATDPDDANIRLNLADAYRWSGQPAKATATYDQAMALAYKEMQKNPKDSDALGDLALCYAKKGDTKRGLEFIARARAIDPKDSNLMYVQAVVYTLAGQNKEALASLAQALREGYSFQEALSDPDLRSLRGMPEFSNLASPLPEAR